MYKCRNEKENDDCPAFFISKYAMHKHFIKHHKPYFCIPCDKDFVFKDRLARHKGWREHGMDQPNFVPIQYYLLIDESYLWNKLLSKIKFLPKSIKKWVCA